MKGSVTALRQMDPAAELERVAVELDNDLAQVEATFRRFQRYHAAAVAEIERLRAERERLEFYDETAVAAMFGDMSRDTFADLRRQHALPHRKIGQKVVYTRDDIDAISEYFKVGRRSTRKAA